MPITRDSQRKRLAEGKPPANSNNKIKGVEGSVKVEKLTEVSNALITKDTEKIKDLINEGVNIASDFRQLTIAEKKQSLINETLDLAHSTIRRAGSECTAKDLLPIAQTAFKEASNDMRTVISKAMEYDLQDILKQASDPVYFAQKLGFEPDSWQQDLLNSKQSQIHMVITRQGGKSTITALKALHQAIFKPGLILVVSPGYRQSKLLLEKFKEFYEKASYKPLATVDNVYSMEFENGSAIYALPNEDQKIRGFSSVKLIIIDEGAWVSQEMYNAVRPMRAVSQGDLIVMSTFNGKQGWFYDVFQNGQEWQKFLVTADQCPRISKEFLESEKKEMPLNTFLQEYYCQAMDIENAAFNIDDIEASVVKGDFELYQ